MNWLLREFQESDYQDFHKLYETCHPEKPRSLKDFRFWDAKFELKRFLLLADGSLLGAYSYHKDDNSKDWAFVIQLSADASRQLEILYQDLTDKLSILKAVWVNVTVREDQQLYMDFYQAKGFYEYERRWESYLDLETFKPEDFQHFEEKAKGYGVSFKTLADLEDKLENKRMLYDTVVTWIKDVPFAEELNIWPFGVWLERFWQNPSRHPESYFLAFLDGKLIGQSELRKSNQTNTLATGLTAVSREHRRKGIAQALKYQAAHYAKTQGFKHIHTQNHANNRAMLSINEAMGFQKEPAWLWLRKDLLL
ncbi:MAG: GNAT family N-acetyltransferase [Deinococcales bacterium]